MRVALLRLLPLLVCLAASAVATATPSLEELHSMLVAQQAQIAELEARAKRAEKALAARNRADAMRAERAASAAPAAPAAPASGAGEPPRAAAPAAAPTAPEGSDDDQFTLEYELGLLEPTSGGSDYAFTIPTFFPFGGFTPTRRVPAARHAAHKLTLSRRLSHSPWTLSLGWTSFDTTSNDSLFARTASGFVVPTRHVGFLGTGPWRTGASQLEIGYRMLDLSARRQVGQDGGGQTFLEAGLRRVGFSRYQLDSFNGGGFAAAGFRQSDFDGVGLRAGVERRQGVGRNLQVVGGLGLSVLRGTRTVSAGSGSVPAPVPGAFFSDSETNEGEILPGFDAKVGLRFERRSARRTTGLELGYRVEQWQDVFGDLLDWTFTGQPTLQQGLDLGLSGPYMKVSADF